MKIRTDFVTNSSSSSFILEIGIQLKNGKYLEFEAEGGTGETGRVDFFDSDAVVKVSPKQLAKANSVEELIKLLTDGVVDGGMWDEGTKIFDINNPHNNDEEELWHAYDFIEEIRENVKSMDDIILITIKGDEENYVNYRRTFKYDRTTGAYTGIVSGCQFEKNGESGGDLIFDISDCDIQYVNDEDDEDEEFF